MGVLTARAAARSSRAAVLLVALPFAIVGGYHIDIHYRDSWWIPLTLLSFILGAELQRRRAFGAPVAMKRALWLIPPLTLAAFPGLGIVRAGVAAAVIGLAISVVLFLNRRRS